MKEGGFKAPPSPVAGQDDPNKEQQVLEDLRPKCPLDLSQRPRAVPGAPDQGSGREVKPWSCLNKGTDKSLGAAAELSLAMGGGAPGSHFHLTSEPAADPKALQKHQNGTGNALWSRHNYDQEGLLAGLEEEEHSPWTIFVSLPSPHQAPEMFPLFFFLTPPNLWLSLPGR